MKEIRIFAVAAHRAAVGWDLRGGKANVELANRGSKAGVLNLEGVCLEVECKASTGGGFLVSDQNIILWDTQSIERLFRCSHEYPSMATVEQSSRVKRN